MHSTIFTPDGPAVTGHQAGCLIPNHPSGLGLRAVRVEVRLLFGPEPTEVVPAILDRQLT